MISPFKFLDSYTREDREIFFGRDREIEELYQKVFESRILLVYGISGTGKTSLINCGLANKFEESDWLPISIRRGKNINESLDAGIRKVSITELKDGVSIRDAIQSVYLDHFKPVYLIFDQFEELFVFGDRGERERLIQTVKELISSDIHCKCLFSIREEYLAGVTEFESYIPEFLANRMRVEKMTHQNALEVIDGPCRVNGIGVEEGFSKALLNKLNPDTSEIELTYLQVFLDKIYKQSLGENKFTIAQLKKGGDVSDLLGSFLEEQIGELDDPDAGLVVLKAFVSMQGTKKQIGEAEIKDFASTLGKPVEKKKLRDLLQRFVNLRVLKDKDDHQQYELRHDSLAVKIYEKITLLEKELLEIKEFLDNAFNNFERRKVYLNEADLTYIGPYEDKLFLSKRLHSFIAESKDEIQKVQRRRRRWIASAAAILIVILSIFTAWALRERGKAVEQTKLAEEKRAEAISSRDQAIQAQEEADLARSEAERSREEALTQKQRTDSALLVAEYQRNRSEEQRLRAEGLFEEANTQSQIARDAQKEAELSAMEVQQTNRKAMLQLYLFNAQEFASKSLLIEKNDTLAALLAYSAFELVEYGYKYYADSVPERSYDIRLIEALQKALLGLEDDTLYHGVHWAMDMSQGMMAINNMKDQLLISDFVESDSGSFPGLVAKSTRAVNQRLSENLDGSVRTIRDDSYLRHIVIDHGNRRLVCGNSSGMVTLTELDGIGTSELYRHQGNISALLVSPVHGKIISTARDHTIIVYDVATNTILYQGILDYNASDLALSKERYVIFHDEQETFYRLDLHDASPAPEKIFTLGQSVDAFDLYNQRHLLAVAGAGTLTILEMNEDGSGILKKTELASPHTGMISDILFSPNGKWLSMSGYDGIISLWDISSLGISEMENLDPILHYPGIKIRRILFDDDSKYLVYNDLRNIFIYPLDLNNNLKMLLSKLDGKKLSNAGWSLYVKGEIERPGPILENRKHTNHEN